MKIKTFVKKARPLKIALFAQSLFLILSCGVNTNSGTEQSKGPEETYQKMIKTFSARQANWFYKQDWEDKTLRTFRNTFISPVSALSLFSLLHEAGNENIKNIMENIIWGEEEPFDYHEELLNTISSLLINNENESEGANCYSNFLNAVFMDSSKCDNLNEQFVTNVTDYFLADVFKVKFDVTDLYKVLASYLEVATGGKMGGDRYYESVRTAEGGYLSGDIQFFSTYLLSSPWITEAESIGKGEFHNCNDTVSEVDYFAFGLRNPISAGVCIKDGCYLISIPMREGFSFNLVWPSDADEPQIAIEENLEYLINADFLPFQNVNVEIRLPCISFDASNGFDDFFFRQLGGGSVSMETLSGVGENFHFPPRTSNRLWGSIGEFGVTLGSLVLSAGEPNAVPCAALAHYSKPEISINIDKPFGFVISSKDGIPVTSGIIRKF